LNIKTLFYSCFFIIIEGINQSGGIFTKSDGEFTKGNNPN